MPRKDRYEGIDPVFNVPVLVDKEPTISEIEKIIRGKLASKWSGIQVNRHYRLSSIGLREFEQAKKTFILRTIEAGEGTQQVHGWSPAAVAFGELWCNATNSPYVKVSPRTRPEAKPGFYRVELRMPSWCVTLSSAGKKAAFAVFGELGCEGKTYSHSMYTDAANDSVPASLVNRACRRLLTVARNNMLVNGEYTKHQLARKSALESKMHDAMKKLLDLDERTKRPFKWRPYRQQSKVGRTGMAVSDAA